MIEIPLALAFVAVLLLGVLVGIIGVAIVNTFFW